MGKLVCCIDNPEHAVGVLRVARRLADELGLELVLLNVQPPTEAPGVSAAPAGQERLHEAELADGRNLLARVAREHELGPEVRQRAEIGPTADRILAVCAEEQPDFVVLGSRGRSGLKAAILGSVSAQVATHAPCPCVIVPPDAGEGPSIA
jgi:nucleotide-binding universal stress UspA family protein